MAECGQTDDVLKKCIEEILFVIKPTERHLNLRRETIEELRDSISPVQDLTGCVIKPFGSFASNISAVSGDLDVSVELQSDSDLPTKPRTKIEKQDILEKVCKALQTQGIYEDLKLILDAKVPILQYVNRKTGISCDVSVDNYPGQIKSRVFYWINKLDARFGDMVLLVKEWAKSQGINDPKNRTLNSYSLCLLVIFHFQTCKPALLPPLKEICGVNIDRNAAYFDQEDLDKVCEENVKKFITGQRNNSSLSHLLATFFQKFSFTDSSAVISTFEGQLRQVQDIPYRLAQSIPPTLFVEDPFERPSNAAKSVNRDTIDSIISAFTRAKSIFVLDGCVAHRNELLSMMCTPEVGKLLHVTAEADPYTYPAMSQFLQSIMKGELVEDKDHLHCLDDMAPMRRFLHIPEVVEDDG